MSWGASGIFDPDIDRHLIDDEGEVVIDEVRHHWVVYIVPVLEVAAATGLIWIMLWSQLEAAAVLLAVAFGLAGHAAWRSLSQFRDRFVITNMRVMRIRGVLSQNLATTPISRILDITVDKPFVGRLAGFGHFVFESAAQEQGIRDIRYVSRPDERDLTIQRVIQRSGLRSSFVADVDGTGKSIERDAANLADRQHRRDGQDRYEDEDTAAIALDERVIFSSDDPRWDGHQRGVR